MNEILASRSKADILVVDDKPDNIRFLSNMLLSQGYNVRKALTGQMALTAVQTVIPDLILLDISMPEMDGYEVCKHLKSDIKTSSIPVIFLTALDAVLDKVKAFQIGGLDYITKPFQFEEVLSRIETHLKTRNLQTQLELQNIELQQVLSELKQAQAELLQQKKMAGLMELVAGISHEINNPISFIYGNIAPAAGYVQDLVNLIHLYQKEYTNPSVTIQRAIQDIDLDFLVSDLTKIFKSMETGAERIRTIILALHIFSRINQSDINSVDIHEGIDSTILFLQYKLRQTESRPEIKVIKNYGKLPHVTCHVSQLNQVFLNLLNNAIDALEPRTGVDFPQPLIPTIWICTELTTPSTVTIRIKDNGVGMTEEQQSSLFNPFFTTKPVGQGLGLGLLTSYQIVVERHKGRLTCNSSLGQGTEFVVEIPVHSNPKNWMSPFVES
ncbi:hybrid sensor histidine kinase/response regulator [Aetokthonos hydrillicola Thurmond2011]|jgi:signal transduction histidine kinase|uniref:histidine kinase n=1 Tax=Aetokthonos hydrillicola Thurmond2011 TaxID=2712845 RepID=A0AAP5MBS1_9CYAN|nr:response regulator [Aetokthonos hydrillicola]MBO3464352.1 response regulator [Aetokthonos hydrillicola CCALA 1050]MBW4586340.1 hybrid sensor histidine kinase/response regulator [Aetokthonos hydrillicola CCALA 1050]MDR9897468.1 hybrid sensor histidine kinase/response regulator [Aetokthonos hydrillicola Thurmond2011]